MSLTDDDVRRVADLARLSLTADEVVRYREQLSVILQYVQQLEALDLDGVDPAPYPFSMTLPQQEDTSHTPLGAEKATSVAPATRDGAFVVPRIVG